MKEASTDEAAFSQLRDSFVPMLKMVVAESLHASNTQFEALLASYVAQPNARLAKLEFSSQEAQMAILAHVDERHFSFCQRSLRTCIFQSQLYDYHF